MEPCCHIVTFSIADRQNALEAEWRTVQASRRDLENFLKWIQEAETTVNVLADASNRENALQDSILARELKQQMQVSAWETTPVLVFALCAFDPSACKCVTLKRWGCHFILLRNPRSSVNNRFLEISSIRYFYLMVEGKKPTLLYGSNNCLFRVRGSQLFCFLSF